MTIFSFFLSDDQDARSLVIHKKPTVGREKPKTLVGRFEGPLYALDSYF